MDTRKNHNLCLTLFKNYNARRNHRTAWRHACSILELELAQNILIACLHIVDRVQSIKTGVLEIVLWSLKPQNIHIRAYVKLACFTILGCLQCARGECPPGLLPISGTENPAAKGNLPDTTLSTVTDAAHGPIEPGNAIKRCSILKVTSTNDHEKE